MRNYKKIFVVIGLVALVVMFSATGMHRFVILHNIGDQHASLQGLPDTAVIVNAGSRIGRISFLAGILSPGLLVALALLGVFPLVVRRGLTFFRNRHREKMPVQDSTATASLQSPPVELQQQIGDHCTECNACLKSCSFLSHYGTPKSIANRFDFSLAESQLVAYECSLCGLCTAVCPEKLDPARFFLEVRRRCCAEGNLDESKYGSILGYEKKGNSQFLSWYGLPEGCDTIFFPGCTLPGTRPVVTTRAFPADPAEHPDGRTGSRLLQQTIPRSGAIRAFRENVRRNASVSCQSGDTNGIDRLPELHQGLSTVWGWLGSQNGL